jgi:WD40 repeat protein
MIITAMVWSPNGKYLAVGGAGNNHLFVYDTSSWSEKPILIPTFSGFGIDTLAWRPDSEQIAIGTSRWIEIREIRWKVRDAIPSPPTQISYYPSASPSDRSTLISDPPEVVPIIETRMGTAGMAGIGIASVVLSFSCVAFVFLQRLKYISKRKKKEKVTRPEHDEIGAIRDAENTMSEEDIDSSSPMDRVIAFSNRTKHPNSDNDDDDDYNW